MAIVDRAQSAIDAVWRDQEYSHGSAKRTTVGDDARRSSAQCTLDSTPAPALGSASVRSGAGDRGDNNHHGRDYAYHRSDSVAAAAGHPIGRYADGDSLVYCDTCSHTHSHRHTDEETRSDTYAHTYINRHTDGDSLSDAYSHPDSDGHTIAAQIAGVAISDALRR